MRTKRQYLNELPEGFKQSPRYDNIYLNKAGEIYGKDQLGYFKINTYLNNFDGSNNGYHRFHVPGNRRTNVFLHYELARTFLPGYQEGLVCDHIDGNSLNNDIDNLAWITKSENTRKYWKDLPEAKRKKISQSCSKKIKTAWENGSYKERNNNDNYKNRFTKNKIN